MSATTFTTQHQLMRKNMPTAALEGPFAQQQKIMLYLFPIIFAVSGINFPIGVLIYWSVTNIWSMVQNTISPSNRGSSGFSPVCSVTTRGREGGVKVSQFLANVSARWRKLLARVLNGTT